MESLLKIRNLKVSFPTYAGTMHAVRDVSFDIQKGKTTAIVGESGCGKTVTAKAIMGLLNDSAIIGEDSKVLFEDKNILDYTEEEWKNYRGKECSMIFQDALVSLNPTVKIGTQIIENLKNHYKDMSKDEMYTRSVDMLKLVEIPEPELCMKKYPHELSGGMRQRVMIAMALVTEPKLLIADEPTTALDVTIQAQIMKLLQELQEKLHMTIILITHDMGLVADVADEIVIMYAGKVVEQGECEEIFYHPSHAYTWALLNAVPHIESTKREMLTTIEGSLPNMICPPEGCTFYTRCPYAMNICKMKAPEKTVLSDKHYSMCWLLDERADVTDVPFEIRRACDGK